MRHEEAVVSSRDEMRSAFPIGEAPEEAEAEAEANQGCGREWDR